MSRITETRGLIDPMTKQTPVWPVEYRTKTDQPREPGWYYARPWNLRDEPIQPKQVIHRAADAFYADGLYVRYFGGSDDLRHYDWFGTVPEVREG